MHRRSFLLNSLAAVACAACGDRPALGAAPPAAAPKPAGPVTIEQFTDAGVSEGLVTVERVVRTDAEWRQQLSPASFGVTRQAGTERAFSGPLDREKRPGLYRCICCDTALFDAKTKYDSGTGWPSFWQVISDHNVAEGEGEPSGFRGLCRAPRPRVQRRTAADGPALLHELGRAALHPARSLRCELS